MKIERKKTGFKPIIITIETEEEANYFWHLLNMPRSYLEQYVEEWVKNKKSARRAIEFANKIKDTVWEAFDKVYRPEDMKF